MTIDLSVTPAPEKTEGGEGIYFPPRCIALLKEYEKRRSEEASGLFVAKLLQFELAGEDVGKDVYNPSSPFRCGGRTYLCGRVESPGICWDSRVVLFEEGEDLVWRPAQGSPSLPLEDGFAVQLDQQETIIGGVKAYLHPTPENPHRIEYHTAFYRGCEPAALKEFARGPDRMKDIRLLPLADGRVVAFTRPQGLQEGGIDCGPGVIACTVLENIADLDPENLAKARIIENQFAPGEWGGANELHLLPDGRIGVVGHIAYRDEEGNRHYYIIVFIYDLETHLATPVEIIARRDDFPAGEAKASDLRDVAFPGGMIRHRDGSATLYAGLSDKQAGCMKLPDPFWQEELLENEMHKEAMAV
jgi:hypothetical protein